MPVLIQNVLKTIHGNLAINPKIIMNIGWMAVEWQDKYVSGRITGQDTWRTRTVVDRSMLWPAFNLFFHVSQEAGEQREGNIISWCAARYLPVLWSSLKIIKRHTFWILFLKYVGTCSYFIIIGLQRPILYKICIIYVLFQFFLPNKKIF